MPVWKGKALVITGLVDAVGKDILDNPYVTLNSGETFSFPSIQCMSARNSNEFATQYSFSSGDDAAVVQEWIGRNREKLKDAEIVRVGLMGRGSFASWSYFDIR